MYTKEEDNHLKYNVLKVNLKNILSQYVYSDVFPIDDRSVIRPYPGIIIYENSKTGEIGSSFSNRVSERLTQLLEEPNTKDISSYFFTYIPDYNQMVNSRFNIRTYIKFRKFDKQGFIPEVI